MVSRETLPFRRQNETVEVIFDSNRYTVTIGFDEAGRARELFVDGPKFGSAMQALLSDAFTMLSVALQWGVPRDALMKSLGRCPAFHDGQEREGPASVLGAIMEAIHDQGTA